MRLFEFQAKDIFSQYGVPTPQKTLIRNEADLKGLQYPLMLKAQTLVGGRGKAGGIQKAETPEEACRIVRNLLALSIKGKKVCGILAEECIAVEREVYLAITIDKQANKPVLVASPVGGIDIEQVAKETPEKVWKKHIEPFVGLHDFMTRNLAKQLNVKEAKSVHGIAQKLYALFQENDADVVEINPLAVSGDRLIALDAKIILDDKARYRHPKVFEKLENEQKEMSQEVKTKPEELAHAYGITYIPLQGDIAVISDGAGTGMLTLDMLEDEGGKPSCLCEMGGITTPETMMQSLEIVSAHPMTKAALVILIGGLNRMDEMAEGILRFMKTQGNSLPLAIRMCGTNEAIGIRMLTQAGIRAYDDVYDAVRVGVKAAGGR